MNARENHIPQYHLHKEAPLRRQFDVFDLAEYVTPNWEHLISPHSHSFFQMIWFSNTGGNHWVDFESHEIVANRLFFIAKGQVHAFEKRADYQGVLLHFNDSFIVQQDSDMDIFLNYNLFNNFKQPYFQIPTELQAKLYRYIDQIKDELPRVNAFGHQEILSFLLKSLLISIEREKSKGNSERSSSHRNLTFLNFRALLEEQFRHKHSVSEFARELNITPKTLNTIVKSETGKTSSQIIDARIILEAKRLLNHSVAFVNEIGYDLGFHDPSYFVKYFKKHVGCTPTEFRTRLS